MTVAGTPSTEQAPSSAAALTSGKRLLALGLGASYLVSLALGLALLARFASNPMTVALLGAVLVSVVTAHAGVVEIERAASLKRRQMAAAVGTCLGVTAIAAVVALASGAKLSATMPTSALLFGIAEAFALAYRDELWLRGLPLLAGRRAQIDDGWIVLFGLLAGVSASLLSEGATVAGLALVAASSAFFSVLWVRTGDLWAPVAGHFSFNLISDSLLAGEWLELGNAAGRLSARPDASGLVSWVACAAFAGATLMAWRWPAPDRPSQSVMA